MTRCFNESRHFAKDRPNNHHSALAAVFTSQSLRRLGTSALHCASLHALLLWRGELASPSRLGCHSLASAASQAPPSIVLRARSFPLEGGILSCVVSYSWTKRDPRPPKVLSWSLRRLGTSLRPACAHTRHNGLASIRPPMCVAQCSPGEFTSRLVECRGRRRSVHLGSRWGDGVDGQGRQSRCHFQGSGARRS